jgi:mono/diheme cytochrome c family protein
MSRLQLPSFIAVACALSLAPALTAGDAVPTTTEPPDRTALAPTDRGFWFLTHKPYLPPDFDQVTFDNLWRMWPQPLRSEAEKATPAERRKMAFTRYGLVENPASPGEGPALGYISTPDGWVMNCLACHGGKVAGQIIPGLPNSHTALQTLTEEVRAAKVLQLKPLAHLDKAALGLPLSTTNGTTNSVVFGIVLGALRNPDMSVDTDKPIPPLVHHDMDPPPFWHVKKKKQIYIDGFAPKSPRPLLQFMMIPRNDGETLTSWEPDYADVLAWMESLESPKYPFDIEHERAARGRAVFEQRCAECHGTYGENWTYPERTVPIDVIGTDPVRLTALTPEHRRWMQVGWMSRFGQDEVITEPEGYVAPPLDGIWATGPYFHNGSVPTLWHVLHPEARPTIWVRTEDGYDCERIGLEVSELDEVPKNTIDVADRRRYFNTQLPAKSAAGHTFVNELSEPEKRDVLEYLKTL